MGKDFRESNFLKQGSPEQLVLSSVLHTSRAKLLKGQHLLLSSVQRVANILTPSCENGGSRNFQNGFAFSGNRPHISVHRHTYVKQNHVTIIHKGVCDILPVPKA